MEEGNIPTSARKSGNRLLCIEVKYHGLCVRCAIVGILCLLVLSLSTQRKNWIGFGNFAGIFRNNVTQVHAGTDRSVSDLGSHRSDQPCTHGLFRKHYRQMGYLPTRGTVRGTVQSNDATSLRYTSDICRINQDDITANSMRKCLTKAKLTSIVTMGDSNAQRYYLAIFHRLKKCSTSCREIDKERLKMGGFLPDKRYFTKGSDHELLESIVNIHYRFCSGCGARNGQCIWNKTISDDGHKLENDTDVFKPRVSVTITQHLPMTTLLETAVRILVPFDLYKDTNRSKLTSNKYKAETSPEFFFKLYMDGEYPDVMLIFPPFNHMGHLPSAAAEMRYFHALVKLYIPRTTKVFYMPAFCEFDESKLAKYRNKILPGWKRIDRLNHIMYDVIKDDVLNPTSGIYSFFDLVDWSRDKKLLTTDGVHMLPIWYDTIVSYFWEVYCNSVFSNDF